MQTPLRIALVGYGKMGKAIEQEILQRGHSISAIIHHENNYLLASLSPENTDVAIEFTHPDAAVANLFSLLEAGIPVVCGTTGWHGALDKIAQKVEQHKGTLIYGTNFSVGVNLMFKLNTLLAEWMNAYPAYDPYIEERHHRHKADGPSGTANTLSAQILAHLARKTAVADPWELAQRAPLPEELSVGFVRSGDIVGTHRVAWHSEIDTLAIEHTAHSRRGFALGAVIAAEMTRNHRGLAAFNELV